MNDSTIQLGVLLTIFLFIELPILLLTEVRYNEQHALTAIVVAILNLLGAYFISRFIKKLILERDAETNLKQSPGRNNGRKYPKST